MIKCFLSHSSSDKARYIREVARRLRKETKVYDEETFEEGMSPLEEILNGLDETSLFVLFISNAALETDWVKLEITQAKVLLDEAKISRFYPIIIEEGITYKDDRIPDWMRKSLNIQPILSPAIAARKINTRLTEISWNYHPRLRERQQIFVGRNDHIQQIEERLDDFASHPPIALIASGLPAIGRKSLLHNALKKANLVREAYDLPVISLTPVDSIEDFILKINDLGFYRGLNLIQRLSGDFDEKLVVAKEIAQQIVQEGERILIEDRGALVPGSGEVVDWFKEVVSSIADSQHLAFAIATQFRPVRNLNRTNQNFYAVELHELSTAERNGLLARYAKFERLELSRTDLSFFSDLLTGYPEQVFYAVNQIRDFGLYQAKRDSHLVQQYGSDKARVVMEQFAEEEQVQNFIYLLCKFEFLSYEVLFDIVDEQEYFPILQRLISSSVCEQIGSTSEYIRVNEVIRDYISRSRFGTLTGFEDKIQHHVKTFIDRYNDDNADISDYLFSAQESLRQGNGIPNELIIPSAFIKTIKKLYDEDRNYNDAIVLSDRALQREKYLHSTTVNHIRYIKCQCLARLRDSNFFAEVRNIPEPDKSFLHGFFYRLSGDFVKAEQSLKEVLRRKPNDPRAKGELVLVYMQSDDYESAFELAREQYNNRPSNLINANNYFACLIFREPSSENRVQLEAIIDRLRKDPSDRAQEILSSAEARLLAYYENNEHRSLDRIEEAIHLFPTIDYPKLTKAEIAIHFRNKQKLKEAIDRLESSVGRNAQSYRTFIRFKAMQLALNGRLEQAKSLAARELRGSIGSSLQRLNDRLEFLAGR
ncbi:TIR domain-containing protein [Pseudomonas guariconensis]|uniref:TIR domain-containing protein n=1 Tax=Pseudomonas guariconensis TaxID=1288410 RepID=UPI00384C0AE7